MGLSISPVQTQWDQTETSVHILHTNPVEKLKSLGTLSTEKSSTNRLFFEWVGRQFGYTKERAGWLSLYVLILWIGFAIHKLHVHTLLVGVVALFCSGACTHYSCVCFFCEGCWQLDGFHPPQKKAARWNCRAQQSFLALWSVFGGYFLVSFACQLSARAPESLARSKPIGSGALHLTELLHRAS